MSGYGVVERAISSLGKGFDITCDFRLKYCKGEDRLVMLNDAETRELSVPGFGSFKDVSVDIKGGKGDRTRYQSDILDFNHMSEFFNQKCAVPGKIPSGMFNSLYGFESGSWAVDAANTKFLGLDGYFIALFHFRIDRYPLLISDEVRNAVPSTWDPSALARFIEKYGTHVIVGLSIGGHDVVLLRQDRSSNCEPSHLKNHLDNLGDQLFTGTCAFSPHRFRSKEQKHHRKAPQAFNVFDQQPDVLNSFSAVSAKDGITVICSKRGGDTSISSHCEWLPTVPTMPDAIHFNFIPITSLLKGVPGKGFLSHAINLYMRYKPPIADLQYFLDFQGHKLWAPIHNDLPLGPNTHKATRTPALQFNLMGPKLFVNTTQVTVGKRPVTGMRLYLEGIKCNRLAVHLQHLANPPILLQNKIVDDALTWRGSEQIADDRYFEPVHWKKFSHVCTAPVKYDPEWNPTNDNNIAYLVTGAQLHVKEHDSKTVLHLRLLFAKTSSFCVVHSNWVHGNLSENCHKSGFFSAISTSMMISGSGVERETTKPAVVVDSSVYPTGPPVPVQTHKLLKFVDLSHKCRGPLDGPGHWLVTGARLDVEKGKIGVHVKFSLFNMSS